MFCVCGASVAAGCVEGVGGATDADCSRAGCMVVDGTGLPTPGGPAAGGTVRGPIRSKITSAVPRAPAGSAKMFAHPAQYSKRPWSAAALATTHRPIATRHTAIRIHPNLRSADERVSAMTSILGYARTRGQAVSGGRCHSLG